MKQAQGKNIILSSSNIAQQFLQHKLVDEVQLFVQPVILGNGKPLFKDVSKKLKLLQSKVFQSGSILLKYQVK